MAHDAFGLCALGLGGPVGWEDAATDVAVEAGVGPVGGASDEAVFDGVVVDVFDVMPVVGIVADEMFPIASLPDAAFASSLACGAAVLGGLDVFTELFLDAPPTTAEIAVSGWQGCDAMQMIGQDDPGVDPESSFSCRVDYCHFQSVDFTNQQIVVAAFQ